MSIAQARGKLINNTSIETGLNFGSSVLDVGHVAQPSAPLHACMHFRKQRRVI